MGKFADAISNIKSFSCENIIECESATINEKDNKLDVVTINKQPSRKQIVQIVDSSSKNREEKLREIKQSLEYLEEDNTEIVVTPVKYNTLDIVELFEDQPDVIILHWSMFRYDGFENSIARDSFEVFIQKVYKVSPHSRFIVHSRAFEKNIKGSEWKNNFKSKPPSLKQMLSPEKFQMLLKNIHTIGAPNDKNNEDEFFTNLSALTEKLLKP